MPFYKKKLFIKKMFFHKTELMFTFSTESTDSVDSVFRQNEMMYDLTFRRQHFHQFTNFEKWF